LVIGANLHLVAEPHVVLDVLAGHADIVGDLVDLLALLDAGEDSGPAQPYQRKMPAADEGMAFAFSLSPPEGKEFQRGSNG
jgi:hypothetical protein